jgi:hypothetical protein
VAHETVRWHIGQPLFIVWCTPRQRTRWGLELLTVGTLCPFAAPDNPVPHRTCPVTSDFCALTSTRHCSSLFPFAVECWSAVTVAPLAPDSPLNYSGAHLVNSREWLVRLRLSLVHRTLSGAPLGSTLSCLSPNFDCVPN